MLLDRVTDPHNVGAILRSAEVFGARAVVGVERHAAPETGSLAKAASGALERQPYLRVRNLADAMEELRGDGRPARRASTARAEPRSAQALAGCRDRPVALVLGAEGPGLREKTKRDLRRRWRGSARRAGFGSLNVSNAAAVALYAGRVP